MPGEDLREGAPEPSLWLDTMQPDIVSIIVEHTGIGRDANSSPACPGASRIA